ncbi:MAG: hypothetical protein U1F11_01610 [Steroidobacteraceae bacterium]
MRSPARRILVVALALLACGLLLVEGLDAGASTRPRFTDRDGLAATARCVVLVLGYPAEADGSPGATERERIEWGVQVLRGLRCERLVISGGAAHNAHVGPRSWAATRARSAWPIPSSRSSGAPPAPGRTLRFALPSLEGADAVYIVSEGLHARRGRRYLCRQQPGLCARTRRRTTGRCTALAWKAGAIAASPGPGCATSCSTARPLGGSVAALRGRPAGPAAAQARIGARTGRRRHILLSIARTETHPP